MIAFGSQNQLQSFLAPLGDLLKTLMLLSNLNGFNSSPSSSVQGFNRRKGSSRVWKKKGSKWFYHFPFYLLVFVCIFVRDRALGPFYDVVGPNPREWVESCYCLSKWRFD